MGFLHTGCSCDDIVCVWSKGRVVTYIIIKSSPISDIVVGPQDQVISSHHDGTIKIWQIYDKSRPSYTKVVSLPRKID
jgi:hypothetical protein